MANVLAKFREVLGVNNLISETQQMREYLTTSGLGSAPLPLAVTFPSDEERLRQVVLLANEFGIPLTPASSRFHYHPGSSPVHNGILVDLRAMDKILEVDHRNRKIRVQAGVTWGQLVRELEKEQLMVMNPLFPHPDTSVVSTILDRQPLLDPRFECGEPITSLELVWPTGQLFRTGTASHIGYGVSSAGGAYPYGPGPIDPIRLLQGSQGTVGIVTWANIKVENRPSVNETILIPLSSSEKAARLMAAIEMRRIGRECFALNKVMIQHTLHRCLEQGIDTTASSPWLVILIISGGKWFPREKIAYEKDALIHIIEDFGLDNDDLISTSNNPYLGNLAQVLRSPWPNDKRYWALNDTGTYKRVFFITRLDKASTFIGTIEATVRQIEGLELGIYIQPIEYGGGAHLEFIFFTPSESGDNIRLEHIISKCTLATLKMGAHYTRPHGKDLSRIVYTSIDQSYRRLLQETKECLDPNLIMNPDKLCFALDERRENGPS